MTGIGRLRTGRLGGAVLGDQCAGSLPDDLLQLRDRLGGGSRRGRSRRHRPCRPTRAATHRGPGCPRACPTSAWRPAWPWRPGPGAHIEAPSLATTSQSSIVVALQGDWHRVGPRRALGHRPGDGQPAGGLVAVTGERGDRDLDGRAAEPRGRALEAGRDLVSGPAGIPDVLDVAVGPRAGEPVSRGAGGLVETDLLAVT